MSIASVEPTIERGATNARHGNDAARNGDDFGALLDRVAGQRASGRSTEPESSPPVVEDLPENDTVDGASRRAQERSGDGIEPDVASDPIAESDGAPASGDLGASVEDRAIIGARVPRDRSGQSRTETADGPARWSNVVPKHHRVDDTAAEERPDVGALPAEPVAEPLVHDAEPVIAVKRAVCGEAGSTARKHEKEPQVEDGADTATNGAVAMPADAARPVETRAPEVASDRLRYAGRQVAADSVDAQDIRRTSRIDARVAAAEARETTVDHGALPQSATAGMGVARTERDDDATKRVATDGTGKRHETAAHESGSAREDQGGPAGVARQEATTATAETTGQEAPGAASPKSGAVAAGFDFGRIRLWARTGDAPAFAVRADTDMRGRIAATSDASPAERPVVSPRQTDEPIDARVTAYAGQGQQANAAATGRSQSRSAMIDTRAPSYAARTALGPAGEATAPLAGDDEEAGDAALTPARAEDTAPTPAADGAKPRPEVRSSGWQPLSFSEQGASFASVKASSDGRSSARGDRLAATEAGARTTPDKVDSRDGRRADAGVASPVEQKRGAALRSSPAEGAAGTTPAPAATPAAPLAAGVASAVVRAVETARGTTAAQPLPAELDRSTVTAVAEPVRSIALNLDMREHGQIDLRISLKGSAISLHVKAERADTADALTTDHAALRELLHRAGYETQQVQIDRRDGSAGRTPDGAAAGQPMGAGTSGFSGQAAGDQRAAMPERHSHGRSDDSGFSLQDQDTQDAPRQDRYRGPDRLYV